MFLANIVEINTDKHETMFNKFRNKRIGSKLLEEAMKYSQKYNKKGLSLTCRDSALGFYKKNGFTIIKTYQKPNKSGKLKPCYLMEKKLK